MNLLSARQGYRLWAPTYPEENAVTQLENGLVEAMTAPRGGKRLLDAGCGTGRRLREPGWDSATGVDLCPEMLERGQGLPPGVELMVGDVCAMPVPDCGFDVAWCRLVIGYVEDCARVYAELARVTAPGGQVIVSDFHPVAYAAGLRRTFRLGDDVHELKHHVYEIRDHIAAANAAGLWIVDVREARVGPEVRHFFEEAGREDLYESQLGLPLVLAFEFTRDERCAG